MTETQEILLHLGWGPEEDRHLAALHNPTAAVARVVSEHRGRYRVWGVDGQQWAWPPQGMRRKVSSLEKPGVGDWVVLQAGSGGDLAQITQTLPRRTILTRQAAGERAEPQLVAANLDAVFVVTSMNQDFNVRRLERYLSIIHAGGVHPVVVLNKADLVSEDQKNEYRERLHILSADVPVVITSALRAADSEVLRPWLGPGRTVGLVGSSGVGKSSLVNALMGDSAQSIGDVRSRDDRGRHTTTHRQLLLLPDNQGVLLDTPGMRELQLWTGEAINDVFPDVLALLDEGCQYRDCRHNGEPGCRIAAALEDGRLAQERWNSYRKLQAESAEQAARKARMTRRGPRRGGRRGRTKKRR